MDDVRNVVFLRFRDVTKQNGEIVVYYDNVYQTVRW